APGLSLACSGRRQVSTSWYWQAPQIPRACGGSRSIRFLRIWDPRRRPGPAVLSGNGMKDRAGRADHAALSVQAVRFLLELCVGPDGSAGGRNITIMLRSGGSPEVGGTSRIRMWLPNTIAACIISRNFWQACETQYEPQESCTARCFLAQ
ncbi:unnamed protein product, partial [Polarella glacialis]